MVNESCVYALLDTCFRLVFSSSSDGIFLEQSKFLQTASDGDFPVYTLAAGHLSKWSTSGSFRLVSSNVTD